MTRPQRLPKSLMTPVGQYARLLLKPPAFQKKNWMNCSIRKVKPSLAKARGLARGDNPRVGRTLGDAVPSPRPSPKGRGGQEASFFLGCFRAGVTYVFPLSLPL